MRRQLWGLQSRGLRGGGWGQDDGRDLSSMNHVWIINHSLDSNQDFNSCGVNYLPSLFVFCFFFLLSSACNAANRWGEDGMWGRCCDWPGKGHTHHLSPCGVRLYFNPLESRGPHTVVLWSRFSSTLNGWERQRMIVKIICDAADLSVEAKWPESVHLEPREPFPAEDRLRHQSWRAEDYLQKCPTSWTVLSFSRLGRSHHRFSDSEGGN